MIHRRSRRSPLPLLLLPLLALSTCATVKPTQDLLDARAAYRRAKEGAASKLAPARLLTAEKKLEEAEKAFADDPGSSLVAHRSYLAKRYAELAMAHAELRAARKRQSDALSTYMDSQDAARLAQKRMLAKRRTEIEELEARLHAAKGKTKRLSSLRKQLLEKKKQLQKSLSAERQARQAAEKRASAAMSKLQQIAKIKQEREETIITLSGSVLFRTGASTLFPLARLKLKQVVAALRAQAKTRKIVVKGHTDSRGSTSSNLDLSLKRAQAVRDFLVEQGLDASRISAVGKGKSEPVASNRTATGRAANRRVEIILRKAQ